MSKENAKGTPNKRKVQLNLTRRDVLTIAGAAAGSAIVAPLITTGPLSPFGALKEQQLTGEIPELRAHYTSKYRWGMVIDLDRCIGCEYCLRACSATNDVAADKPWNIVVEEKTTSGQTFYFSRPCLHCQDAPCVEVCPVKATYHRDDGLIIMDYDRCIGCRYCEVACPYDARKFNWEARSDENPFIPTWGIAEVPRRPRGVVEKCTFCVHRIDKGLEIGLIPGIDPEATPACVNACPVGARTFGNLKDPESPVAKLIADNPTLRLREELGTDPNVYYIPPKEGL
ncbi:MAG: 4Fe-4S dicluster domain-containing protein [Anaerolineales bacterium]|nr:4Fe-4S dicluster domain-containing protein [Anaerolineales bacterium]